jgi:hypothetical protein
MTVREMPQGERDHYSDAKTLRIGCKVFSARGYGTGKSFTIRERSTSTPRTARDCSKAGF